MTTIAEYRSSRELFVNLTLRELRAKYKRSFLGWAWSLINPLLNVVVYTLVFSIIVKAPYDKGEPSGLHVYALFLMCALLPWNFFQSSVMSSIGSLTANSNLIQKTYFPRELLPASAVAANLVSHLIEMGLLVLILQIWGDYWALAYLPITIVLILATAVFGLGLGLLLSVLNVYFRDIQHFMGIFFLVWFYGTPILYSITLIHSPALRVAEKINPMTDMSLLFRDTLYSGTWPDWLELGYYVLAAVVMLAIGRAVFGKLEGRLAEEL